tara:strand:- start:216 stop:605 length:390 start_codon:yes stop_codon:yes gene_type:complete
MLTHRARLLLIGGILTAALAATILISTPEATRTVDEVMEDPESLEGREIAIRGEVLDGSIDNSTSVFILHGEDEEILVDFSDASVSNGLDDNRTVYAEGTLVLRDGEWVFEADVIKTSCPSKYEETTDD